MPQEPTFDEIADALHAVAIQAATLAKSMRRGEAVTIQRDQFQEWSAEVKTLEHALAEEKATTERQRGEIMRLDAEVASLKAIARGVMTITEARRQQTGYRINKAIAGWYFLTPDESSIPKDRVFWSSCAEAEIDALGHMGPAEPAYAGAYCSVANGWIKGVHLRWRVDYAPFKAGDEVCFESIKGDQIFFLPRCAEPLSSYVLNGRIGGKRWDEVFEIIPDQYNPERWASILSEVRRENRPQAGASKPYDGPSFGGSNSQ